MSPSRRSIQRFSAVEGGFTIIETLVALVVSALAIAIAMSLLLAAKGQIREQGKELEVSQGARATLDLLIRELRLGGACLPETGKFISLAGVDGGNSDEVTIRSGLTRDNLSCVRAATTTMALAASNVLFVDDSSGFEAGMRVYLRHPDGSGQYTSVDGVDPVNQELTLADALAGDFPPSTGVYAIGERRFFLGTQTIGGSERIGNGQTVRKHVVDTQPLGPELRVSVDEGTPYSFAIGTEALDLRYELNDGTVVDLPNSDAQWASVNQIQLTVTVRSLLPDSDGTYYRRTLAATIKPRNLIET